MTSTPSKYQYKPLSPLRTGLLVTFVLDAIAHGAIMLGYVGMFAQFNQSITASPKELLLPLLIMSTIGLGPLLLSGVICVLLLMWMHRAFANLIAIGTQGLSYTPGWAVGWWFIPVACWFKPYNAMCELKDASSPETGLAQWYRGNNTSLIGSWWACWLGGTAVTAIARRLLMWQLDTAIKPPAGAALNMPEGFLHGNISNCLLGLAAGSALTVAASILSILVISRITADQQAKFEKLSASSTAASAE